jgi:hypothetical protein
VRQLAAALQICMPYGRLEVPGRRPEFRYTVAVAALQPETPCPAESRSRSKTERESPDSRSWTDGKCANGARVAIWGWAKASR